MYIHHFFIEEELKILFTDDRNNIQNNEVALDYNARFTVCLSGLVYFGLGIKDTGDIHNFDRVWPPKDPTLNITISMTTSGMSISTGSRMVCSVCWVSDPIYGCTLYLEDHPNYIVCNARENHYLDGEGTP